MAIFITHAPFPYKWIVVDSIWCNLTRGMCTFLIEQNFNMYAKGYISHQVIYYNILGTKIDILLFLLFAIQIKLIKWYNTYFVKIKMHYAVPILHYNDVIAGAMASQITSLTIVYATIYSGADQSKHQDSASLAFVWGIHRGNGQ